ncbi:MAG: PEP-CTERM sorting domain-containing protein [Phycisphaerae bacterium]|nr:PEP-CTERM sorting domain-containing protein [Phycisphaerae bacterium]
MKRKLLLLVVAAVCVTVPAAWATSYASGVTDTGGGTYSFVLNEDAANVKISRVGDTTLNLGALSAGTHTFSVGAGSGFDIQVASSSVAGWHQISTDGMSTSYYSPRGVSVNKNPWSQNFGSVYVTNASAGTTGAFGHSCIDGLYRLDAAMNETASGTGGVDWTGASNPYKCTVGPDDHLYVCDFTNDRLYELDSALTTNVQLIRDDNKLAGQYVSSVYVEGTQAGGDRVVYTTSSNYPTLGAFAYNLGGRAALDANETGQVFLSPDAYTYYPYDLTRDSNGDWYTAQYRWGDNQAHNVRKFDGSGTWPLGDDAAEVLWETADMVGGVFCLDVFEEAGLVAAGFYDGESLANGEVHLFDMATGAYVGMFDSGMSRMRDLSFDAAGNIYMVDNYSELLRVFSPGGDWIATTGSDGTFTVVPEPTTLVLLTLGGLALLRRR